MRDWPAQALSSREANLSNSENNSTCPKFREVENVGVYFPIIFSTERKKLSRNSLSRSAKTENDRKKKEGTEETNSLKYTSEEDKDP